MAGQAQEGTSSEERDGYRGPVAPSTKVPAWKRRLFIDRPGDLEALGRDLSQAHIIAIDAEFVQVRVRPGDGPGHRLALLQFAMDDDYRAAYVVDALRLLDLSPLEASLTNGAILKLFHGVSADLRMLASRGLHVTHLLDLEAVSRSIFGQRESGLQTMLQRAAHVRIDKSLQRADWGRRPLTPAMVAYAARDAEMTYVLYGWLAEHYPWAVTQHELRADETMPALAAWILPFLEGGRGRLAEVAVTEAGLAGKTTQQERALRQALMRLPHPGQRTRIMRMISDLGLVGLIPDLRPYLKSQAADERAGAARALGRLHDVASRASMEALTEDPVEDVRMAAANALEFLKHPHEPGPIRRAPRRAPDQRGVWTIGGDEDAATGTGDDWRSALRAQFGLPNDTPETTATQGTGDAPAPDVPTGDDPTE